MYGLFSKLSFLHVRFHAGSCTIKSESYRRVVALPLFRGQETVKHYPVTARDNEYDIGYKTFASLKEFVDHFNSQPLIAGKSGKSC